LRNLGYTSDTDARLLAYSHVRDTLAHASPEAASGDANADETKKDDEDTTSAPTSASGAEIIAPHPPANVLERLIKLAGQAPAALVESWAASHGKGAAVSVQSKGDHEAEVFVFTTDANSDSADKASVQMSRITIPQGSGGAPMEVVFTDTPLSPSLLTGNTAMGFAEQQEASSEGQKPKEKSQAAKNLAQMSPYLAPTMLALLSLSVILALIAVYYALGYNDPPNSRKAIPADLEANGPADSKPKPDSEEKEKSASVATDEEKAAAQLAEQVLRLLPPSTYTRVLRSPRPSPRLVPLPLDADSGDLAVPATLNVLSRSPSPYLTPRQSISEEELEHYPDPEDLELLIDVAAQTLPQLSTMMPGSLDSQVFSENVPAITLEDVAGIVRSSGADPVLPLQIAMLFPYLNDGWVLKFFVVLFGWWSVVLSPQRASQRL